MAEDVRILWDRQAEWSQATFGTDAERGPTGPLKHLEHEAREAQAAPDDPSEYADCFLLILDAARRSGMTWDNLLAAAIEKHERNRHRTWARPTSDAPVFHVAEPD
jgi:hypothetical protein